MTRSINSRFLVIAIVVSLWLGAMAWLIFQEAYPGLLSQTSAGYHTLLSQGIMVMDRWMIISFQGKAIGYTHTAVDVNEKDPIRHYQIRNRTLLTLSVMGNVQRLSVNADATVDTIYNLQTFTFSLSANGYSILVEGHRRRGQAFDVTIRSAGSIQRLTVTIPTKLSAKQKELIKQLGF